MVSFLAIIGFIVIFWFLSRALIKVGSILESFGNLMIERAAEMQNDPRMKRVVPENKITDKIKEIRGEETDEDYQKRVREEIQELIDPD